MKHMNTLIVLLFCLNTVLMSCSEQDAIVRENLEMGSETNNSKLYFENSETEVLARHKIILIPFQLQTNQDPAVNYSNPGIYKTIFFSSFYNLFSSNPMIEETDKTLLANLKPSDSFSDEEISNLGKIFKCDFIIFGDYSLKGPQYHPDVFLNLMIWNRFNSSIMTNTMKSPTDIEIFDTIDSLYSMSTGSILEEEKKISYLTFNNLDTGDEKLAIFINHRLVAQPFSNNYTLNMKILSGKNYRINIRRNFYGKLIKTGTVNLKPGESLSFSATNSRINLIKNGEFEKYFSSPTWHNSPDIKIKIEGKECHIKIRASGDHSINASPFTIEAGKSYRVSFNARASQEDDIYVKICSEYGIPYWGGSQYGISSKRISISKDIKTYMYIFKMLGYTDPKSRFVFNFSSKDVWLSDVMVEEL